MSTEMSRRRFLELMGAGVVSLALQKTAYASETFLPQIEGPESPQDIIHSMFGRDIAFDVLPEVENLENAQEILPMIAQTYRVMRDALYASNAHPDDVLLPNLKSIQVSVDSTLPDRGLSGQTITTRDGELQLVLLSPGIRPDHASHEFGHTCFRSDRYGNEKYTHNAQALEEAQAMIFSYQTTLNAVLDGVLDVSHITRVSNELFNRWHVQMAPDIDKKAFNKMLGALRKDPATKDNHLVHYLPYVYGSEFAFRSTVNLSDSSDKGKGPTAFVAFKAQLANPGYTPPQDIGNLFPAIYDKMIEEGHIADGAYRLESHVLYTGAAAIGWDSNFIAVDEVTGEYVSGQRINGLALYLDSDGTMHPLEGLSTNTGNHLENPSATIDHVDVPILRQGRFKQEGSPSISYILQPETQPQLSGEYRFHTDATAYDLTRPDIMITRSKDHALKVGATISQFTSNFAQSLGISHEHAKVLLEEQSLRNEKPLLDEVITR